MMYVALARAMVLPLWKLRFCRAYVTRRGNKMLKAKRRRALDRVYGPVCGSRLRCFKVRGAYFIEWAPGWIDHWDE